MNRSSKIILIIIIILFITGLFLYFYLRSYMPKYRWVENYNYQNEQPYGLKLIYDILSKSRNKNEFVMIDRPPTNLLDLNDTSSLYLFIGADFTINPEESNILANYVKKGNTIFISSINSTHQFYSIFSDKSYQTLYAAYSLDSIVNIRTGDSIQQLNFKFNYRYGKKLHTRYWFGMDSIMINDTLSLYGFEQVSSIDYELIDCYRVKYGKGWFVFHHNPILFTNYYLREEQGLRYANTILSQYQCDKIYWDEYSKVPLRRELSSDSNKSALQFILSERSLRWSWYLLCIFTLVFVVFNSKRRQVHIPLLPDNENTTVEYIQSIATLHFKKNAMAYMADEMLKQFQTFVKQKYGITYHIKDKEVPDLLSDKTGIPPRELKKLFENYIHVKYAINPGNNELIEFYKSLEFFYQNCK